MGPRQTCGGEEMMKLICKIFGHKLTRKSRALTTIAAYTGYEGDLVTNWSQTCFRCFMWKNQRTGKWIS